MIERRVIAEDSFLDAFGLKPAPGQKDRAPSDPKPFGASGRVALTCNKNDPAAGRLYESRGFQATGAEDGDEIELALTPE